jgi:hypothetical protein
MLYRIIAHGYRTSGYGPFDSEGAARDYAAKYLQDYRCQFVAYEAPPTFDGEEGTYSDPKCGNCSR